jgi:2-aminoadipate transaminase
MPVSLRPAKRMSDIKPSFIREILSAAGSNVISFAGGLPHPETFPVEPMRAAADRALAEDGRRILQYTVTEGYLPLRQWIARRYSPLTGIGMEAEDIIVTNGSQQAFDLIGKAFVDPGDVILTESPSYLGALQSFEFFGPRYETVALDADGVDPQAVRRALTAHDPKIFYGIPAFQNPSGRSYSDARRSELARVFAEHGRTVVVEDDPYGELRFEGNRPRAFAADYDGAVLLGSFSKIAAPGLRLGWIYAPRSIRESLVLAKQAADLHTGHLTQAVLHRFLEDNDFDAHIARIVERYRAQRDAMAEALREMLPMARFELPQG